MGRFSIAGLELVAFLFAWMQVTIDDYTLL
jgi:hypothetical protein